jgi:hypothetical protein
MEATICSGSVQSPSELLPTQKRLRFLNAIPETSWDTLACRTDHTDCDNSFQHSDKEVAFSPSFHDLTFSALRDMFPEIDGKSVLSISDEHLSAIHQIPLEEVAHSGYMMQDDESPVWHQSHNDEIGLPECDSAHIENTLPQTRKFDQMMQDDVSPVWHQSHNDEIGLPECDSPYPKPGNLITICRKRTKLEQDATYHFAPMLQKTCKQFFRSKRPLPYQTQYH